MIKIDKGKVEIEDVTELTMDTICDIMADITIGVLFAVNLLVMVGNDRKKASEYMLANITKAIENKEENNE